MKKNYLFKLVENDKKYQGLEHL